MMIASPGVSVVVPSKNRPALLAEAVNSVLSQSMPDLELIVIDDCSEPPIDQTEVNSTGDTRLRLERLCAPSGAVVAKNRGLSLARSPILAFLDDDDLYKPTYIERSLRAFERYPALDVVFMGVEFFTDCPDSEVPQHRELMNTVLAASGANEIEEHFYVFSDGLLRGLLLTGLPMAFQRPVARQSAFERLGDIERGCDIGTTIGHFAP
jgi:glycosyltransferase involved in cell wall biosynthesis